MILKPPPKCKQPSRKSSILQKGDWLFYDISDRAKPKDDSSISGYITELLDLRNQLVGTPQAMDDSSFKEHFLSSLPFLYKMLVTIMNEEEEDISIQDKIQREELTLQNIVPAVISPNTSAASGQALYSSSPFRG
jgi:hypothetical protein